MSPRPGDDPEVRAILDALALTTAAAVGDVVAAREVLREVSRDGDTDRFLEALVPTIQLLVDEAADQGVDVTTALRDVALGVQIAHLAEAHPTSSDDRPGPPSHLGDDPPPPGSPSP